MDDETGRHEHEEFRSLRGRIEILSAVHSALERWPEVAALAFASESVESLSADVSALLGVGAEPARAVVDMQVRRIPRAERERIRVELDAAEAELKRFRG